MTVSPYLGPSSLHPAVDGGPPVRRRVVRARPDVQPGRRHVPARPGGDRRVAQVVVDTVRGWNSPGWVVGDPLPDVAAVRDAASRFGPSTGSFGVVVGATLRELDVDLDGLGGPILAPGLGAQGGPVADLGGCSAPAGPSSPPSPGTFWQPAPTPQRCGRPPTGGRRSWRGEAAGARRRRGARLGADRCGHRRVLAREAGRRCGWTAYSGSYAPLEPVGPGA